MSAFHTRGFSTIELLIAFGVAITFISGAIMVAFGGQSAGLDAKLDGHALHRIVSQVGDAARTLTTTWGNTAPALVPDPDLDTYAFKYTPANTDPLPYGDCNKKVASTIDWTSEHGRTRNMSMSTIVSKIVSDQCGDPTPPSDWDNPENPDWKTSPADIEGTQTDLDFAWIDGTPYVFMTTKHSSQKDDFWVIDVTDVDSPVVLPNHLETGGVSNTKGLNAIEVVKNQLGVYAYVVQNDDENQLQIIDINDPTNPQLVNTISFETWGVTTRSDPINPGTDPEGRVVYYHEGKIYAGLKTTVGPELLVFDVSVTPDTPTYIGSINPDFNHTINDMVVVGNYAYLATGFDSREVMIVNISGTTPIDTNTGFDANLSANDTEDATTITVSGNKLFVGRERTDNTSENDFYVLDISSPLSPTPVKQKRLALSTSSNVPGYPPQVIDMVVQGHIAFLATTDTVKPFQVWDIENGTGNTIIIIDPACSNTLNLPKVISLIFNDDLIYAANGNQAALNILRDDPNACTP